MARKKYTVEQIISHLREAEDPDNAATPLRLTANPRDT